MVSFPVLFCYFFFSFLSAQLIRVRSKDGNFRFDLQPTSDISEFLNKVISNAEADSSVYYDGSQYVL